MTLRIVDVSNFKPGFDPALADCDGVVVQCTWGAGELTVNGIIRSVWPGADPIIQRAAAAGRAVGYMHYIRGVGADAEARFFASASTGYLHRFVPGVDWEEGDNAAYPDPSYLDRWLGAYIALTGVHPLVYRARKDAATVDPVARKHDCGVWDADYADGQPTGWQEHPWSEQDTAMRQYTSHGRIGGYDGDLDLDLFYGDRAAWDAYAQADGQTPTTAPSPPAASGIPVHYAMHLLGGDWQPEVTGFGPGDDGFAGLPCHAHDLLYARVDAGVLRYRVHLLGGDWQDWVNKGDPNDTANGCAGIPGRTIDAFQAYYQTPDGQPLCQAWYRAQTANRSGWLPACCDDGTSIKGTDGWAGMAGEPLDRLQLTITDHNPF